MNDYLKCPFCKMIFPLTKDTFYEAYPEFGCNNWKYYRQKNSEDKIGDLHLDTSGLIIQFNKCPACKKVTIDIIGAGSQFPEGFRRRNYLPLLLSFRQRIHKIVYLERSREEESHKTRTRMNEEIHLQAI